MQSRCIDLMMHQREGIDVVFHLAPLCVGSDPYTVTAYFICMVYDP